MLNNGWIRLWIVLSVCWLVIVSVAFYDNFFDLFKERAFEVSKDDFGKTEFVFSRAQNENVARSILEKKYFPLIDKEPAVYQGKVIDEPYNNYVSEHLPDLVIEYSFTALVPVMLVLLLGISIAWVRRGFKN